MNILIDARDHPDRGRILHTDDCYAPCMRIVVQRDAD